MERKRTEKEWKIKTERMDGRKIEKETGWIFQIVLDSSDSVG